MAELRKEIAPDEAARALGLSVEDAARVLQGRASGILDLLSHDVRFNNIGRDGREEALRVFDARVEEARGFYMSAIAVRRGDA